jgi:hypothetical protein
MRSEPLQICEKLCGLREARAAADLNFEGGLRADPATGHDFHLHKNITFPSAGTIKNKNFQQAASGLGSPLPQGNSCAGRFIPPGVLVYNRPIAGNATPTSSAGFFSGDDVAEDGNWEAVFLTRRSRNQGEHTRLACSGWRLAIQLRRTA